MMLLKKAVAAVFDFLQSIVVVLAIMVVIYLFVLSPQEISGNSMVPTFHNGEYILTNKIEYKLHEPTRGDVIIFRAPNNPDKDYIKRIIGLPGERIRLENGIIYINAKKLNESYLSPAIHIYAGSYLKENQEIVIPEGRYFVMGDNRPQSSDSRDFGPVGKEAFIGKAILRYWPFDAFTIINGPTYTSLF